MKRIDIDGVVHLSSRERWGALIGGLAAMATAAFLCWFLFSIPLEVLRLFALIAGVPMAALGLSAILLAIRPEKTYWVQEITSHFLS